MNKFGNLSEIPPNGREVRFSKKYWGWPNEDCFKTALGDK